MILVINYGLIVKMQIVLSYPNPVLFIFYFDAVFFNSFVVEEIYFYITLL